MCYSVEKKMIIVNSITSLTKNNISYIYLHKNSTRLLTDIKIRRNGYTKSIRTNEVGNTQEFMRNIVILFIFLFNNTSYTFHVQCQYYIFLL